MGPWDRDQLGPGGSTAAPPELSTHPVPHQQPWGSHRGAGVARLELSLHGKWGRACLGPGACSEGTGRETEVFKDTWPAQEHAEGVRAVTLPRAKKGLWGSTRGTSVPDALLRQGNVSWEGWAGTRAINQSSPGAGEEIPTHPSLLGQEQGQPPLGQASSSSFGSASSDFLPIFFYPMNKEGGFKMFQDHKAKKPKAAAPQGCPMSSDSHPTRTNIKTRTGKVGPGKGSCSSFPSTPHLSHRACSRLRLPPGGSQPCRCRHPHRKGQACGFPGSTRPGQSVLCIWGLPGSPSDFSTR